ncbi:hypothetical protein CGI66_20785 [Vibrio parahaemolyticus]|uniref:DUF6701 domain-containing protein n=1 Tax=Vibrio parahaemolyticus TaxID=670 RepID=UPI00112065BC|nr:DUF6701 domain-containing protein [Vibrio parahaemolyticus]TOI13683.1 hypothetical protein CGI66_20785 [Vibrio parahaemolyticus]HCH2130359.1 hypothetical protein [Vibrio parahaemolyticus]
MKKLIFLALIWAMGMANVLAAEYDITPVATYHRWKWWKFAGWVPRNASNLCTGGFLEGQNNRTPQPTTYVCPYGVTLKSNDTIVSDSEMTIRSGGGILLKGNNYIGNSIVPISLVGSGEIKTEQDTNIISGNVTASGNITFKKTQVGGNVSSQGGEVKTEVDNNIILGNVTANGNITLKKTQVGGAVTSQGGEVKTEADNNIILGNVTANGNITLKTTQVGGTVTSLGGEVKTESNENEIQGGVWALKKVTLKQTKVTGDVTSEGDEVLLESHNQIHGNVLAHHKVDIKHSLVCGQVKSQGAEVSLNNSKFNQSYGVYAPSEAIHSFGKLTVKSSTVCGSVNSLSHSYDFNDNSIYCGVDDPSCQPPQAGACPIETVTSLCPELVPDISPTQQCKPLPPENFDNGSLANWSVMGFKSSTHPQATGKRFRLNENIRNQATASAYNYVFPSAQNYLQVEFDHYAHSGSGGDGIALVLSDAKVPPQTGAFGGPLGYGMKRKINHPEEHLREDVEGFAGGWLGVGFDEYGNYYRTGGETILQDQTLKPNVVGIRGEGALDANGKWLNGYEFIKGYGLKEDEQPAEDIDGLNRERHSYRIILNSRKAGKYYLSVERKIGSQQWKTLIEKFDVYQQGNFNTVPENFRLSVTASTGWATNTHEIDDFQVCADKYQKITNVIHHFEFEYAKTGSICQASDVILRACMNDSCSETYPSSITGGTSGSSLDPVTVSLLPVSSSTVSWEGGDSVTFSDSVALKLRAHQSGSAELGIDKIENDSEIQLGFTGTRCLTSGALTKKNCKITFNSAALGVNTPDKIAGRPFLDSHGQLNSDYSTLPYLDFCGATSTKQAGDTGETRNITLSMEHVEPINPVVDVPVYVAFKQQSGAFSNEVSIKSGTPVPVENVYFDSKGKASFNLRYPEVGKVRLHAQLQGDDDSKGENNFVSFPKYLKLAATKADKNGACTTPDDGCSNSFIAAGEEFDMTITAYQAADGNTEKVAKNYQEPAITITNSVEYPKKDGASATLLNTSLPGGSKWANGKVVLPQSVSEVGAFEFSVAAPVASDENGKPLATSSYLGSSTFKIQDAVATIGRFYPAYFNVTETNWDYPDNQGESAYMGQAFDSVSFAVTAYNASGGATQNYGLFASGLKADFYLSGEHSDRLNIANKDLGAKNWSGAVWRKQWNNSVQWSKPISPDGPFNSKVVADKSTSTSIGLSLSNSGGKTSSYIDPTLFRFKSSVDGKEQLTTSVAQVLLAQPDVRFGRIDLDDVGGNQGSTLHVPLRVEYWNGSRFIANPNDNQTEVTGVKAAQQHIWPTDQSAKDVTLGEGGIVTSGSSRSVTATQAEPYRQQTRVWLDLDDSANGLPWLKYNWDNKNAGEENPSSVVTFGIHRGNDRVIYRGEPGLTGQ